MNYQEGPFKNWTGISFPAGYTYTVNAVNEGATGDLVQINQQPAELGGALDPALLQGVLTGDTSGASVNLSNIPITYALPGSTVSPPGCEPDGSYTYTYPAGAPVGSAPFAGAQIAQWTLFAIEQVDAFIRHLPSYTTTTVKPDPGDPSTWYDICVTDDNHDPLPGFILGETVTITYP